jgi:hypothetical protein
MLQKLDRHASLAMTVVGGLPRSAHDDGGGGLPPQFAMKVVCHASLAVMNVVIANAVKQSIAVLQKLDRHASLAMMAGVGCHLTSR